MKVVIFGATGMLGQGVLRETLLADDVEQVVALVRTTTGVRHPKLREVMPTDFADLTPVEAELQGVDACFFCLGLSPLTRDEALHTTVNYDYPMAAARTLAGINPESTFVYVSGAGASATGSAPWARIKARTERAVLNLFPNGYVLRPGFIQPTYAVTSKGIGYRLLYRLLRPLTPALTRIAPGRFTTTNTLARTMLRAARTGLPRRIIENSDL